jgi:hypothetical protein
VTYTCAAAPTEKSQDIYGIYLKIASMTSVSSTRVAYEAIVSMTTFNIFTCIRIPYDLFDIWTLEIVPTLYNLVCKLINYNH